MKTVDGIPFECRKCGACCRWEGKVYLKGEDIRNLSELLGIDREEFLEGYTERGNGGVVLLDKPGTSECVFLESDRCRVWDRLPGQCRELPDQYDRRCPGFRTDGRGVMEGKYEKALKEVTSKLAQDENSTRGLVDRIYRDLQKSRTASEEVPYSGMDDFLAADRVKVASLDDLLGFDRLGKNHLIHKSSKDLWGIDMDKEGNVQITRMFDNNGEPIKG